MNVIYLKKKMEHLNVEVVDKTLAVDFKFFFPEPVVYAQLRERKAKK